MERIQESYFTEAKALSSSDQAQLADLMGQFLDYVKEATKHDEDLKNPKYRAEVKGQLDNAEAQRSASAFVPMREAMTDLKAKFKQNYGL